MTEHTLRSVSVERTSTGHFTATNVRGGTIGFGTGSDPGDTDFTPVELLLAAIGGCTAVDVDVATSRHAEPTGFAVTVTGNKISDELGNRMTDLVVTFSVAFPDGEPGDRARAILPGRSSPPTTGSARSAARSRSARPSPRGPRTPDPTETALAVRAPRPRPTHSEPAKRMPAIGRTPRCRQEVHGQTVATSLGGCRPVRAAGQLTGIDSTGLVRLTAGSAGRRAAARSGVTASARAHVLARTGRRSR